MLLSFFTSFYDALPKTVAYGIIWGIMAIGVYITFRLLDFPDLTVDGSFATGGAVMAMYLTDKEWNLWACLLMAFIAGGLAGLMTGIFHTKFGIPAILAGILSQLALYSINLRIMDGKANQAVNARNYDLLIYPVDPERAIWVSTLFALALIVILYWFFGTELGSSIRATGTNAAMARANGINTSRNTIIGLVLSNAIVGLSGALYVQWQGSADVQMGRGAIVIGLAAVIIGEVLLGKIFKNFALRMVSCVVGGVVYYVTITLVLQFDFMEPSDLKLLTALVVALFLGVPYWKGKLTIKRLGMVNAKKAAAQAQESSDASDVPVSTGGDA